MIIYESIRSVQALFIHGSEYKCFVYILFNTVIFFSPETHSFHKSTWQNKHIHKT